MSSMRRLTLAAWFLTLFAAVEMKAATEVVVRSATTYGGSPREAVLTASPAVVRSNEQPVIVKLSVPGRVVVELAEGVWRLDVKAPGWFHAGDTVAVKGDASVTVPIWLLGSIHGKVKTSDDLPVGTMTARWSASTKDPSAMPEGEVSCAVALDEYRCAVPAGLLDLKLRSKGYVSQFLWQVEVGSVAAEELPLVRLKRGAALFGWVEVGKGVQLDRKKARVFLTLESSSGNREKAITTTVDERGFFAFRGVDPGAYGIAASATKDVGSEERRVVVRKDGETELLRPLVLERREPLRVTITPPVSPSGTPWQVTLVRPRGGNAVDTVAHGSADVSGVATLPGLAPGAYAISVMQGNKGEALARRSIEMPGDADLAIGIRLTNVVGTIRMRDGPVGAATVWLGGKYHSPGVRLTSEADGTFSGVAPFDPETSWEITVSAKQPALETTVHQRPVRESETTVRLDLEVPAAMIEGIVLEATGLPAATATVNVLSDDGDGDLKQVQALSDGSFELVGLTPGDYKVDAEGSGGRRSPTSVVSVPEDGVASVKLTLGTGLRLSGRVISEDGAGVSGAQVYVISVEAPPPLWMPRRTTATGDFDLLLPDGTRTVDVFVIAPGFSFRAFRPPVKTDQQLMILLRQNGGGLDLVTPMWNDSSARVPYLVHNGTALRLMFLLSGRLASVSTIDGSTLRTVAPLFEPGSYGLCLATQAEIASAAFQTKHCSFGNLAPFGSLALSVKDPDAIAGTP